ncbi:hypothetical protein B0H13DRAFT_1939012 [Mycena leptocephala]|nr:hypothetical protein B0H13DRAFT_1939012 [Mycena leptocephala]
MKYPTRCFHFDGDGHRLTQGYHSSGCKFAHPDDPEWVTARPPPPRTPSKYPIRNRDSRSRSPRRRSRSPVPSSYSSRHRRNSTSDPRMDSRPGPSRPTGSRAPGSVTSHSPAPSRQLASPFPPPLPVSHALPPPPPPPSLPFPPSLPPAFTASDTAPKPASPEEMKVMWEKVLPLMATCVEARKVHQDSQKDLHDFERMLQTPRYTTLLTDADKERVAQKLVELKAARDQKGKEVTNALSALKDTNWWPVGPNQDEGAAEKYRDLIQYALQLDKTASEMYQAYVTKTLNAPAPVSASGAVPQTAVDVSPHDSARPLKRRRVSNAADDAAPSLDPADVAELEKMRERLESLDERVAEIQNDLMSLETQNADDIFAQIDARLEGFSLEPRDHADGPSSSELKRVEESVKKTNKDIDDLGLEIALLISETEKIRTQSELLDKEREKQNADFAAMKLQFQALEESSKNDQETIFTLTMALEALTKRAPPSLPLEFIVRAIDEPIRDAVQSAVRPMVDNLAKDLDEKIVKQDAETYGHLWGKIALTLKLVEAVHKVTPTPAMSPAAVSATET